MGNLRPLVIGELVVPKPVIQGGMGVGISLSSLAGAVARAGGMGIISTAQIGFREPDLQTIRWRRISGRSEKNLRRPGRYPRKA